MYGITSLLNPFHLEGQPLTTCSITLPCWQSLPLVTLHGLATSWLDKWSHQYRGGLLLQAAKPLPDEEEFHACIDADMQCLHLISIQFDSEMWICEAMQHWRCCMAYYDYGLALEFIFLD